MRSHETIRLTSTTSQALTGAAAAAIVDYLPQHQHFGGDAGVRGRPTALAGSSGPPR